MTDEYPSLSNEVRHFIAACCALDGSVEMSVADMFDAWAFAQTQSDMTVDVLKNIGRLIDPRNLGFRSGVEVARIESLLTGLASSTDFPWLTMFDDIRPFEHGNARVKILLFNWYSRMMDHPWNSGLVNKVSG